LRHHIENIGKRALEQSGKYRVNKNDEENFAVPNLPGTESGQVS
jgi:hypothetical protein